MSWDAANTTPWPTDAELPSPEVVARGHLFDRWREASGKRGGVMARHGFNAGWEAAKQYIESERKYES